MSEPAAGAPSRAEQARKSDARAPEGPHRGDRPVPSREGSRTGRRLRLGRAATSLAAAVALSAATAAAGAASQVVDASEPPPASAVLGLTGTTPAPDGLSGSSDRWPRSSGGRGSADTGGSGSPERDTTASPTLEAIAECESGGDPTAVSADGQYRGKYQFSQETWEAVGGTGDPVAAPEAVQDQMAARLLAESGTSAWPSCG